MAPAIFGHGLGEPRRSRGRRNGTAATTCRSIRWLAGPAPTRPPAAKPYDGGQPTGAPDHAGKAITIVDVPKLIGIGYFNATSKGIQDAAKELGNVKATHRRPDRGQDR